MEPGKVPVTAKHGKSSMAYLMDLFPKEGFSETNKFVMRKANYLDIPARQAKKQRHILQPLDGVDAI